MILREDKGRFSELSDLVDDILSRCNDDAACIASELRALDPDLRRDILTSDLLNAWQVFSYYFNAWPGDEAVEFLVFNPASELIRGVPMGDFDILSMTFFVHHDIPEIRISDDIQELARFSGASAWEQANRYITQGE